MGFRRPRSAADKLRLEVSGNGRYLVDGYQQQPFLLRGDTPWELVKLSPTDVATYLDDRQSRGFNAIIIEAPISPDFVATNYNGDPSFNSTTGGQSDVSTPNANWFARVQAVIKSAYDRGFYVWLFNLYQGFTGTNEGFYADMVATESSSSTKLTTYGNYVGNITKYFPNVGIAHGGDFVPDATGLALIKKISDAIKATDPSPRLHTYHCGPNVQTYEVDSTTAGWRASVNSPFIGWEYSYEQGSFGTEFTHTNAANNYASSPTAPFFLGEAHYEFSSFAAGDSKLLRRQSWGAMLGGACGTFFGQEGVYNFQTGWQSNLASTGTSHETVLHAFFAARAWHLLVPSTGSGFVSSGGGTSNTSGYKPRAVASDGSWGAVHVTDGSATTINFAPFNGTKNVKLLDPSNGSISTVGTHANSGTQSYTPSGANAAGDSDWVLVIE
jgi:hypothetical protein